MTLASDMSPSWKHSLTPGGVEPQSSVDRGAHLESETSALTIAKKKDPPSIWQSVLESSKTSSDELGKGTVIVLGNPLVGKRNVIQGLQRVGAGSRNLSEAELFGETSCASSINYAFINVRAVGETNLADVLTSCDVWIVENENRKELLMQRLEDVALQKVLVLICIDLSEPWTMLDQLQNWLEFCDDVVRPLLKQLSLDDLTMLRKRLSKCLVQAGNRTARGQPSTSILQNNPQAGSSHGSSRDASPLRQQSSEGALKQLPSQMATMDSAEQEQQQYLDLRSSLGENPDVNLGIPIIICVCKADMAPRLDTKYCVGAVEVLLTHIRRLARPYGAAVLCCSTRQALTNRTTSSVELLYRYMMHRIYDFDLRDREVLNPVQALFIPSGADSVERLEALIQSTVAESFETPVIPLLPPMSDYFDPAAQGYPRTDDGLDSSDSGAKLVSKEASAPSKVEGSLDSFLASLLAKTPGLLRKASVATRSKPSRFSLKQQWRDETAPPPTALLGSPTGGTVSALSADIGTRAASTSGLTPKSVSIVEPSLSKSRVSRQTTDRGSTASGSSRTAVGTAVSKGEKSDTESLRAFFQTLLAKQSSPPRVASAPLQSETTQRRASRQQLKAPHQQQERDIQSLSQEISPFTSESRATATTTSMDPTSPPRSSTARSDETKASGPVEPSHKETSPPKNESTKDVKPESLQHESPTTSLDRRLSTNSFTLGDSGNTSHPEDRSTPEVERSARSTKGSSSKSLLRSQDSQPRFRPQQFGDSTGSVSSLSAKSLGTSGARMSGLPAGSSSNSSSCLAASTSQAHEVEVSTTQGIGGQPSARSAELTSKQSTRQSSRTGQ